MAKAMLVALVLGMTLVGPALGEPAEDGSVGHVKPIRSRSTDILAYLGAVL